MTKTTPTVTLESRLNIDFDHSSPAGIRNWPVVFDIVKMTNINKWPIGSTLKKHEVDELLKKPELNVSIVPTK